MTALKQIYKGSFQDRPRFDTGGGIDYASAGPSAQYYGTDGAGNYTPADATLPPITVSGNGSSNSGGPSSTEISNLTAGATTGNNSLASAAQHDVNSNANPGGSAPSQGALGSVLKALGLGGGNTSNTKLLEFATGLLGAYGHYKQNQAVSKLPTMPSMGGLPTLPGTGSTGYGPAGGYGFQNYGTAPGATAAPGLGFTPKTPTKPAPSASYFTYGSGPEQQFFQQVMPGGGPIVPVHARGGFIKMATGGEVPRFDMGGMIPPSGQPGQPPMSGMPGGSPLSPQPNSQPNSQPTAPPQPSTMMQRMQAAGPGMMPGGGMAPRPGMRPFAVGGATMPPDQGGALSQVGQSRHVTGPGDGTSDSIPARLANGEYVIDAQAVSMLGNGDNGAGAKRLDEFRKNLRAHKGAALSKGRMAPNAKPIHTYMSQ